MLTVNPAPLYPINETINYFIKTDKAAIKSGNLSHLLKSVSTISNNYSKDVTSNSCEARTFNASASLLAGGKLKNILAGGHLILDQGNIDLRIYPGKITYVKDEPVKDSDVYRRMTFFTDTRQKKHCCLYPAPPSQQAAPAKEITLNSRQNNFIKPLDCCNIEGFWRKSRDIHHLVPRLEASGYTLLSALKMLPCDLARQVATSAVGDVLKKCHAESTELMIFVGNEAVVQIHSGKIDKIVQLGKQRRNVIHSTTRDGNRAIFKYNIDDVAQVWAVNKMSQDGVIKSLDIFDKEGNVIFQFFGLREEGKKQPITWINMLDSLQPVIIHLPLND